MGQDTQILTLTYATERDIDLLLVEELKCNGDFLDFICSQISLVASLDVSEIISPKIIHSKRRTYSRREIDILVQGITREGKKISLLIENKLTETEQPRQAESYLDECTFLRDEFGGEAFAILVCPRHYVDKYHNFSNKFHAIIYYENIQEYFEKRQSFEHKETARRMSHRADMLKQAALKLRRGYEPIPVEKIGDFNKKYTFLISRYAPNLVPGKNMLKTANPSESVSMLFDHKKTFESLPEHLQPRRLSHELGRGLSHRTHYAAITFPKMGHLFFDHRERLESDVDGLPFGIKSKKPSLKRPDPGLIVYIETPPVDNQADFEANEEAIKSGIAKISQLCDWVLSNQKTLEGWYSLHSQSF